VKTRYFRSLALVTALTALPAVALAQPTTKEATTPESKSRVATPEPAPAAPVVTTPVAEAPATPEEPPKPLGEVLRGLPKADYISGRVLFEDGDYAAARIKFQNAYEASNDPRLLWNIAACEKALRRYARTLKLLERYVQEGGALLSEQDRADADSVVSAVRPLVSKLSVTSLPSGAEVLVDDESFGPTPLADRLVDIGDRRIVLRLSGYEDFVAPTAVKGGESLALQGELKKIVHEGTVTVVAKAGQLITIDGKGVGDGRWTGALSSGPHTLRVTATGYRAYQTEITVRDRSTRTIQVELEREASAGVPSWVWIAGGVVLVSGATVGGFLLFSKEETVPAEYYRGNLAPGTVYLP
jgi:PEGA domain